MELINQKYIIDNKILFHIKFQTYDNNIRLFIDNRWLGIFSFDDNHPVKYHRHHV